jgi:DNA uptake protein ComE-like DNA-binding protein
MLALGAGARAQESRPATKKPAPSTVQTPNAKTAAAARAKARAKAKAIDHAKRLDLNSATKAQLEKLPSMTPAYADQIIAHRPYLTNEHLVLNKAVPESVYFAIRELVTARQPGVKAAPAKKATTKK